MRPPGLSTRNVSANTAGLSTDKLITQLEITTSIVFAGNGMASMVPLRNSTFVAPAFAAFAKACGGASTSTCRARHKATRTAVLSGESDMLHDTDTVHVRYMVDDVAAAVDFYTTRLGFAVLTNYAPAFADVKRTREGGKGYAGVIARGPDYLNPFLDALERGL